MQDDPLTRALYLNYQRAGKETGYWGYYFLRDLKKHGGLKVAKALLAKKIKGGESRGFLALADAGRPDLSVEYVVLSPQFRELFSEQEIAVAEQRLKRFPTLSRKVTVGLAYPDEVAEDREYHDGAVKKVFVNRYERDPAAREVCLAKHGRNCKVCGLNFEQRYGDIGKDFIHVHHLKPLGLVRKAYQLDPKIDLVPVCPNCHAMLHMTDPPLSVEQLKRRLVK